MHNDASTSKFSTMLYNINECIYFSFFLVESHGILVSEIHWVNDSWTDIPRLPGLFTRNKSNKDAF